MKDEDQVLAEFRTRADELGLATDEVEDAIARAREVASSNGLPLEQVLFEETAEESLHMGREG